MTVLISRTSDTLVLAKFIVILLFCQCHVTQCADPNPMADRGNDPRDLKVRKASFTFLWVSWSPPTENVSRISGYQVKERLYLPGSEETIRHVPVNMTTCYLRGLSPGTRYSFYVVATYDWGLLAHSNTLTAITEGYGPDRSCNCSVWGSNQTKTCDPHSGQCECRSKWVSGRQCDGCHNGYYHHQHLGCEPCNCHMRLSNGTCRVENNIVLCNCRDGHSGKQCDLCENGLYLVNRKCTPCKCNGNENKTSPKICDTHTGQCLACGYNTTGDHCDSCLPGFDGDAMYRNCTSTAVPAVAHSAVVIIVVCFGLVLLVVLVLVICTLVRWRRPHGKSFWSVQLRDDRENVNFSALTDQPDPNYVDAALLSNDSVEFAKKHSLEFQGYSPQA